MDLLEISSLVQIRNYMNMIMENTNIDNKTAREIQHMILSVDKTILKEITSESFKGFVSYKPATIVQNKVINSSLKK